ncbi:Hypothetical predicted protein [Cloeon dipterum]|uniref:Uncharacterized protein n=1 Tax=Cloeon dipterum TaxID=197152 RepID=A0A8S1CN12_9INSE|nr:Hypothetical predicted protein [Cloeon dipterum]
MAFVKVLAVVALAAAANAGLAPVAYGGYAAAAPAYGYGRAYAAAPAYAAQAYTPPPPVATGLRRPAYATPTLPLICQAAGRTTTVLLPDTYFLI